MRFNIAGRFLWGYVKSLVYADKPETNDAFEENIRRVIADIRPPLLQKVVENWSFFGCFFLTCGFQSGIL